MTTPTKRLVTPSQPWRDGDEWLNDATGVVLHVEESAGSTNGQRLIVRLTFPPSSPEPPLHYHPQQTEMFTFLQGSLRVMHAHQTETMVSGDQLLVRPGEPHAMWNPFDEPAVVRWQTSPALQTERWLGMLFALAEAGRTNDVGVPPFLQLALLLRAYRREIRLCQPPAWVQMLLFPPAAMVARLAGHRAERVRG